MSRCRKWTGYTMVGDQNVNPPDGTLAAANWKPESALASGATSPTSPSCKENSDNQIQTTIDRQRYNRIQTTGSATIGSSLWLSSVNNIQA